MDNNPPIGEAAEKIQYDNTTFHILPCLFPRVAAIIWGNQVKLSESSKKIAKNIYKFDQSLKFNYPYIYFKENQETPGRGDSDATIATSNESVSNSSQRDAEDAVDAEHQEKYHEEQESEEENEMEDQKSEDSSSLESSQEENSKSNSTSTTSSFDIIEDNKSESSYDDCYHHPNFLDEEYFQISGSQERSDNSSSIPCSSLSDSDDSYNEEEKEYEAQYYDQYGDSQEDSEEKSLSSDSEEESLSSDSEEESLSSGSEEKSLSSDSEEEGLSSDNEDNSSESSSEDSFSDSEDHYIQKSW
ncbi:unnamed protein product [Moneuplotes crassus]|uniref:Uncharacterized protein n=1 Tax=Euplotes crassus TaxID=5936 RepID=A0AAD1XDH9_EUPCR|nr:unnamed protein product [Moneuplotes crassus]